MELVLWAKNTIDDIAQYVFRIISPRDKDLSSSNEKVAEINNADLMSDDDNDNQNHSHHKNLDIITEKAENQYKKQISPINRDY